MKNLFQFLAEAGTSRAAEQAAKLNLKSDGHGGWIDSRGSVVATTEKVMDVAQEDQWEGASINERRLIIWSFSFQLKTYLYGPAKESRVVKEAITQLYSKREFSGLDDTQVAMATANVRTVQVPNPTTADADDSYTVTETQTDNI